MPISYKFNHGVFPASITTMVVDYVDGTQYLKVENGQNRFYVPLKCDVESFFKRLYDHSLVCSCHGLDYIDIPDLIKRIENEERSLKEQKMKAEQGEKELESEKNN
jgi:hypothetical protein